MFYLFIFVIVFSLLRIASGIVSIYAVALAVIATALFIVLIGALQLRQDDRLSEKSFVELIKMTLEQLPLIGNLIKIIFNR